RHLHVFFEPPQTSAIYTLSLHDALPISVQVDTAVGVGAVLGNLVAAFTVDHHAAAGVDHAHNGVAGNWAATVGEGNHQPFGTLDGDGGLGGGSVHFHSGSIALVIRNQLAGHDVRHAGAQADFFQQHIKAGHLVMLNHPLDLFGGNLFQCPVEAVEGFLQQHAAEFAGFRLALVLEVVANA